MKRMLSVIVVFALLTAALPVAAAAASKVSFFRSRTCFTLAATMPVNSI